MKSNFCRHFIQLVFTADPSGRLLKYDPKTKKTTVLLRDLQFPNGVSMSKDGSFFVFCEGSRGRFEYHIPQAYYFCRTARSFFCCAMNLSFSTKVVRLGSGFCSRYKYCTFVRLFWAWYRSVMDIVIQL
jgi:Strictosidine synthase